MKVIAPRVGRTRWRTTHFPTKEKDVHLAIKASVRKKEGIEGGDRVQVEFSLDRA